MKKYLIFVFFIFLTLQKLYAQDSVKIIIIGFENNKKYQITINQHVYEFSNLKFEQSGCLVAVFPKRFFNSEEYYIKIRCRKKFSFYWGSCEIPIKYDSSKKYFLSYRDYSAKSACFRVDFSNEIYSKRFEKLYEEGSEKIYGPTRIIKL